MANVLPRHNKATVRRFYLSRFTFVGSLAAIACGAIAALALVPAYTIVAADATAVEAHPEISSTLESDASRDAIRRAQTLIRELQPIATSTASITEVLEGVLAPRPAGVLIDAVSISRLEEGMMFIEGSATSRDDVVAYRDALLENSLFTVVSVPIQALVGGDSDRFTMTIEGTF